MPTNESEDYKLCYVAENIAWFTTASLDKQWGNGWRKVPMECNAEPPSAWDRGSELPSYELMRLAFRCLDLDMVYETSVEMINRGMAPWLFTWDYKIVIPAGICVTAFKELVREAGGEIFVLEEMP